jgi:hypothetical protein
MIDLFPFKNKSMLFTVNCGMASSIFVNNLKKRIFHVFWASGILAAISRHIL